MEIIKKSLQPDSSTITNRPTLNILGLVDVVRFTRKSGSPGDPTKFVLIEPRDSGKTLPALNFEKNSSGRVSFFVY